jgi:uncharacterized protein YndB with AHSA1/START domain
MVGGQEEAITMPRLHFEISIRRSPETVFQLLSDLSGYRSWLPPSRLYSQTTAISDQPIKAGTTYSDKGPSLEMQGEVTEFEPLSHLAFRQSAQLEQAWFRGRLDIRIRYTLHPIENGTRVIRDCRISTYGMLTLLQPILLMAIRRENERILHRMKWYLEAR